MKIINSEKTTIKSWCPDIEDEALTQMKIIANLPYVQECCIMPDGHLGKNCCIGGVVATNGVVVPDFVGVDIGCGMIAFRTNITEKELNEYAVKIHKKISQTIPVGFAHNKNINNLKNQYKHSNFFDGFLNQDIIPNLEDAFFSQLGTLGGGNHFIEIQIDEDKMVWVMIHSGSRNIGYKIGEYFNEKAIIENKKWYSYSEIPFLPVNTEIGKLYLKWMGFALDFAKLNRQVMANKIFKVLKEIYPHVILTTQKIDEISKPQIEIHHNFASLENHHGKNVWVHRKGATKATKNLIGIIPGSMGTSSYITRGLGNHQSLMSASHGAGRLMGRRIFSRSMKDKFDEVEKSLNGIVHSKFNAFQYGKDKGLKDVSEAPMAYKKIDMVMENQKDLVEILVKLTPKISVKG